MGSEGLRTEGLGTGKLGLGSGGLGLEGVGVGVLDWGLGSEGMRMRGLGSGRVSEVGVRKVVVLASNSPRIKSSSRQIVMYSWAFGVNGHFGQMGRVWNKWACAHLPQCPLVLLSLSVLNFFICVSFVTIFLLILSPISLIWTAVRQLSSHVLDLTVPT